MENQTALDNSIVTAGPPVPEHLSQRLLDRAKSIQRQLPGVAWEWCVEIARLESLPRDTPKRTLLAQAASELRSERAYSESNGGWRHGVNQAAARRIP